MALADLPSSGSANFESNVRITLHDWRDAIDQKALSAHTHGDGGGVSMSIAATFSALSDGNNDGEFGEAVNYMDLYGWDNTGLEWIQIGMNLKRAFLM